MAIKVNKQLCPENHRCPAIGYCPVGAMKQDGFSAPVIDKEKCIDCGKCIRVCPMGALNA